MGMNNIWGFKYDGEKWSDGKFLLYRKKEKPTIVPWNLRPPIA
jgi:hypothetical protein